MTTRPAASSAATLRSAARVPTRVLASEDQLLVAAAAGDHQAFAQLYDVLRPRVVTVARRVLRDGAMAEEVAQDVLTEVWQKAATFDPSRGSAGGWVATLAHRRAIDRVRSEHAARNRHDRVGRLEQQAGYDEVVEAVETSLDHAEVRGAVAELSQRQREAIELAYFGDNSYREVARLLGIPEGTAKSRLRDAIASLRTALEPLAA